MLELKCKYCGSDLQIDVLSFYDCTKCIMPFKDTADKVICKYSVYIYNNEEYFVISKDTSHYYVESNHTKMKAKIYALSQRYDGSGIFTLVLIYGGELLDPLDPNLFDKITIKIKISKTFE